MLVLASLITGLTFGFGLVLSGMADPVKVLGFLDLAGSWDPSLAFVMGGAIAVSAVAFAVARKRRVSLLGAEMKMPTARRLDPKLIVGSTLFGAGWGMVGLCPGPAMVALGMGEMKALVFVAAMLIGMTVHKYIERSGAARSDAKSHGGKTE